MASKHISRTFFVIAGTSLFLLSSSLRGRTQTKPEGIQVETNHDSPFVMRVELRSGAETRISVYKNRLPWGSANSMILVAVMPDGQTLKKELPVDDPSPEQVTLNPKEAIRGQIDLRKIFRGLDDVLRRSDVQLFWAYEAPEELNIPHWSGGWILLPKQK